MLTRVRSTCLLVLACAAAPVQGAPADELVAVLRAPLAKDFAADWRGIEKLPGTRWAPLPPRMLDACLPDGGCFLRQGQAHLGGRRIALMASGPRTFVTHLYLRNVDAAFGEADVLAALQRSGVDASLARCPVPGTRGGTDWYKLSGKRIEAGVLAIQSSCNGKPCEGFVLTFGEPLPPLLAQQLLLYSEHCAAGEARTPVSTRMPHELLADMLAKLLPPAGGPPSYSWQALAALPTDIHWNAKGAQRADRTALGDTNPWSMGGQVELAQRPYYATASGTQREAHTLFLEEGPLHRRGEDVLGALRARGLSLQLVRCGPIYTQSINNWYRVTSAATRPVMLRQSLRLDGDQVQDSYEIRLDASLPKRDPRDRDPGVQGCR